MRQYILNFDLKIELNKGKLSYFASLLHRIRRGGLCTYYPEGCRKTSVRNREADMYTLLLCKTAAMQNSRDFSCWHFGRTCQLKNVNQFWCERRTVAGRTLQNSIMIFSCFWISTPTPMDTKYMYGWVVIVEESGQISPPLTGIYTFYLVVPTINIRPSYAVPTLFLKRLTIIVPYFSNIHCSRKGNAL